MDAKTEKKLIRRLLDSHDEETADVAKRYGISEKEARTVMHRHGHEVCGICEIWCHSDSVADSCGICFGCLIPDTDS